MARDLKRVQRRIAKAVVSARPAPPSLGRVYAVDIASRTALVRLGGSPSARRYAVPGATVLANLQAALAAGRTPTVELDGTAVVRSRDLEVQPNAVQPPSTISGVSTPGRIPYVHTDGTLTEEAGLTYEPSADRLTTGAVRGTSTTGVSSVLGSLGVGVATPTSYLHVFGSFAVHIATVTASTTLGVANMVVFANATSGAFTVTLPSAVGIAGRVYEIVRTNSGANVVTVGTTSSQLINAATTYPLNAQFAGVRVVSTGANWIVLP
jgi:hypothetical protein